MDWLEQPKAVDSIAGERRGDRRYDIQLELKWRLIRRKKVVQSGVGHTVDFSSGGVLFDAGRELVAGLNVELSVSWPVLLHKIKPMQLVISGKIVRVQGTRAALRMTQHEFRTAAMASVQRAAGADGAQAAPFVIPTPRNSSRLQ
jgi:hypothetical protein